MSKRCQLDQHGMPRDMTSNDSEILWIFNQVLKTSADAPQRELILHTTFGKIAKGIDHLSADTPRLDN